MATPQNSNRTHRRGPSIVDCVLALSVIAGLAFVTVRMMSMGTPPAVTQTAETGTAVVKTDPLPLAPDAADVKTP
ncbi:MAG TPA: hypothetical protein VHX39_24525 [Acetobacteraceae bacterium]|nr:hypothetical protein [Acetobacteraceae bacterium]